MKFRVIDGCPCPASSAPYVFVILRGAGLRAESIYRGSDARSLLHAHGKHDQTEIHEMYPAISNPPGRSTHELRSDGVAYPSVPVGGHLEEWRIGVDAGPNDEESKRRVEAEARKHGWEVFHPYSRVVEGHHFCFLKKPRPRNFRQRMRLIAIRARLPRR